ncbi:MAG: hypothetical protein N2662_12230 [Bacteroidales bacterium]|nr:hypothetical protein [Bacteroidales bacterium]
MERTKYLSISLLMLAITYNLSAYTPTIYQAYVRGDMKVWKHNIDSLEKVKNLSTEDTKRLLNYQYGYIAWCLGTKNKEEAKKYLHLAQKNLNILENTDYTKSMIYAYKAAFTGYEIGISPYKAPVLGEKSLLYAERSITIDSLNWFGHLQLANIYFYKPPMFGGSKAKALKLYLKALHLMEKNKENLKFNWNYLNLHALIIKAFMDLNQYPMANKYCNKILALEPQFDWVKNKLQPEILKKLTHE